MAFFHIYYYLYPLKRGTQGGETLFVYVFLPFGFDTGFPLFWEMHLSLFDISEYFLKSFSQQLCLIALKNEETSSD